MTGSNRSSASGFNYVFITGIMELFLNSTRTEDSSFIHKLSRGSNKTIPRPCRRRRRTASEFLCVLYYEVEVCEQFLSN